MKQVLIFLLMTFISIKSYSNDLLDKYIVDNFCFYQERLICIDKKEKVTLRFKNSSKDSSKQKLAYVSYIWTTTYKIFDDTIISKNGVLRGDFSYKCKVGMFKKLINVFRKKEIVSVYRYTPIHKNEKDYQLYRVMARNCSIDIMFVLSNGNIIKQVYLSGID